MPLNLPPPDLLRPLSPEEAAKENAERPFVERPDTPAASSCCTPTPMTATARSTCLTQAVYYEAAGEGVDGGRAVAQVVLNRMRHPGYPASVCGVVYQGSERAAGCQFTFTCDGSLLRTPVSRLVGPLAQDRGGSARRARCSRRSGTRPIITPIMCCPIGRISLDKTVQIGRHIFYRLRGTLGEPNAFSQHYAGPSRR